MRHRVYGKTLGRKTNHRIAMFRNMSVSLFTHGQITTTLPKAKAVQPFVEKLISAAKQGDLASRRRVISKLGGDKWFIPDEEADGVERNKYGELKTAPRITKVLFDEVAPKFADRQGGYTRIIRLGKHRIGDGADLVVLQLVGDEDGPQVSGKYSRRRDKANKRMEYAAKLRKGDDKKAEEKPAEPEAPAEEAAAET
ncbi:MAG: 50S ribosomal protein L17, partial [Planctomycetota bacterium]